MCFHKTDAPEHNRRKRDAQRIRQPACRASLATGAARNIGKQKGNSKTKISSWKQLETITIAWIAGNGTNGGNAPDVKVIYGGFNEQYGFRKPERLSIEFFDIANKCMSNSRKILFNTKARDPTQAEAPDLSTPALDPEGATPRRGSTCWSGSPGS